MVSFKKWAATAALLSSTLLATVSQAAVADSQANIDHAVGTLQDLRHDKEFGTARDLMRTARAVMIAPRIFKAGFFVGGEGGDAVLVVRGPHGWSDPAFYTIASASFGLQIGAQESEMILFIRSEKALEAVLKNRFKIGADASISVATLGSDVQADTTTHGGADIIAWASSSGVYAGISLAGSVLEPKKQADAEYYGHPVTTSDIVLRHKVSNPGTSALLRALATVG